MTLKTVTTQGKPRPQGSQERRPGGFGLSVGVEGQTHQCLKCPEAIHCASCREIEAQFGGLAMLAAFVCDLDGTGGSRPEIGARSNAPLAHSDHLRRLCAIHFGRTEASGAETHRIRSKRVVSKPWSDLGPINRLFMSAPRDWKRRKCLKDLVELTGIEPVASSLRTRRSPS